MTNAEPRSRQQSSCVISPSNLLERSNRTNPKGHMVSVNDQGRFASKVDVPPVLSACNMLPCSLRSPGYHTRQSRRRHRHIEPTRVACRQPPCYAFSAADYSQRSPHRHLLRDVSVLVLMSRGNSYHMLECQAGSSSRADHETPNTIHLMTLRSRLCSWRRAVNGGHCGYTSRCRRSRTP